jgi:hypothetical protein
MDLATLSRRQIEQLIAALEARIADCQARLPAHSIPPAMVAELDELDEQLAEARQRLQFLDDQPEQPNG